MCKGFERLSGPHGGVQRRVDLDADLRGGDLVVVALGLQGGQLCRVLLCHAITLSSTDPPDDLAGAAKVTHWSSAAALSTYGDVRMQGKRACGPVHTLSCAGCILRPGLGGITPACG